MISVVLMNIAGAASLAGSWTLAVTHAYRSLAADERYAGVGAAVRRDS